MNSRPESPLSESSPSSDSLHSKLSLHDCNCWQGVFSSEYCSACLLELGRCLYARSMRFYRGAWPMLSFARYQGVMREFVTTTKMTPLQGLMPAQRNFLARLAHFWSNELSEYRADLISLVPGHPLRSRLQTDLAWELSLALADELQLGPPLGLLKRKLFRRGELWRSQKQAGRRERLRFQFETPFYFAPPPTRLRPSLGRPRMTPRVLLVDDVCATGATLNACAKSLEQNGYEVVALLVLAQVEVEYPLR